MPEAAEIIQQGIDKLKDYETRLDAAPANIVATCKILSLFLYPLLRTLFL